MDDDDGYDDGVWYAMFEMYEMEATGMLHRAQEARMAAQLHGLTAMSAKVETVVRENETLAGDLDHHMALLASKSDTLTGGSVPEEHQVCSLQPRRASTEFRSYLHILSRWHPGGSCRLWCLPPRTTVPDFPPTESGADRGLPAPHSFPWCPRLFVSGVFHVLCIHRLGRELGFNEGGQR